MTDIDNALINRKPLMHFMHFFFYPEVTCKGLTPTTTNDYTSQAYHGTK